MAYNRVRKERAISFRVTEEQWQEIAKVAAGNGDCPTDWCRDLALAEAQKKSDVMTAEGRLLLEELARVRYLIGNGLWLLANNQLVPQEWENARATVEQKGAEIADQLISKRCSNNESQAG